MSDQLETVYQEINVWECVSHYNIIKIFDLFDSVQYPEMFLVIELASYGSIQF